MVAKKRCFVVMGFGIKTDLATGRKLNLDNAYRNMIKPAVEQCGLECVRADEILHSGNIEVQMYRELLTADVVVADISTANCNAIYELGVRHALRPWTTVVISEDLLKYPFDLNHIVITPYKHMGDDVGVGDARQFINILSEKLKAILNKPETDSPIYTYLANLAPPALAQALRDAGDAQMADAHSTSSDSANDTSLATLCEQGEQAIREGRFGDAKVFFSGAHALFEAKHDGVTAGQRYDPYVIQRLAFTTYRAKKPTAVKALGQALDILQPLSPKESNDPETIGLAGAIYKRLYRQGEGDEHLNDAIGYYSRGYFLRTDSYNGINLAYLMNLRAGSNLDLTEQDKIADLVTANRVRLRVLDVCRDELAEIEKRAKSEVLTQDVDLKKKQEQQDADRKFWCFATMAQAHFGLGKWQAYEEARRAAIDVNPPEWMTSTLAHQIQRLRSLLEKYGRLLDPPWQAPAGVLD